LGAVIGTSVYFTLRWTARKRVIESLSTSLFLIKIPRASANPQSASSENKDFKSELAHFEQLLASFTSLKKPFTFEIAVPHVGEEIHFYLAVPKLSAEVAAKQIQGLWSGASVEPVPDDFNIFNMGGATSAAYLSQKQHYGLPVKTYAELG